MKDPTYYSRLYEQFGSLRRAAEHLGIPKSTFKDRLDREKNSSLLSSALSPHRPRKRSGKKRYVVTAAQNDTAIFEPFVDNLLAYCEYLDAELMVLPMSYVLPEDRKKGKMWAQKIAHLIRNERILLHDGLHVCGEMDIRPTAVHPLSGLDSYTKSAWGIFPHSKVALKAVPVPKGDMVKHIMTTGAITVPNYIPRKTGLKAVFHHVYGAVIVEIDHDEDVFWCRHVIGDDIDGSFYDLDVRVHDGSVEKCQCVDAMVLGDIHIENVDAEALADTMDTIEYLAPKVVVVHDLIDFRAKNHHNIDNPVHAFHSYVTGADSVEDCFRDATLFLNGVAALVDNVVVVPSNHHDSFKRWITETDYREDPVNALFYLEEAHRYLSAVRGASSWEQVDPFVLTMTNRYKITGDVKFLVVDEKYDVNGVSVGYHGHNGPNGSRGNVRSFSRISMKTMIGHTHTAEIVDGAYSVGTLSKLDMGYNKGPSSWSHTNGIVYKDGSRTLITRMGGGYYMQR